MAKSTQKIQPATVLQRVLGVGRVMAAAKVQEMGEEAAGRLPGMYADGDVGGIRSLAAPVETSGPPVDAPAGRAALGDVAEVAETFEE